MTETKVNDALTENYRDYYNDGITEWRELGAIDKSNNILNLGKNLDPDKVLEIGCGEGSILKKLSEKNFGRQLYGIEISESGVEMVIKRNIKGLVECKLFDGYKVPYSDKEFDFVILSHVVEHVEHPRLILAEARRVGKKVFVEVPLEHTFWLKKDFVFDHVGHINFYSPVTIRNLIQSCGFKIINQVVVNPSLKVHLFLGSSGFIKYYLKKIGYLFFPGFAPFLFTYNSSILCEPE